MRCHDHSPNSKAVPTILFLWVPHCSESSLKLSNKFSSGQELSILLFEQRGLGLYLSSPENPKWPPQGRVSSLCCSKMNSKALPKTIESNLHMSRIKMTIHFNIRDTLMRRLVKLSLHESHYLSWFEEPKKHRHAAAFFTKFLKAYPQTLSEIP